MATLNYLKDFSINNNLITVGNLPKYPTKSKDSTNFQKTLQSLMLKNIEYKVVRNMKKSTTSKNKLKEVAKKIFPLVFLLKLRMVAEKFGLFNSDGDIIQSTFIEDKIRVLLRD